MLEARRICTYGGLISYILHPAHSQTAILIFQTPRDPNDMILEFPSPHNHFNFNSPLHTSQRHDGIPSTANPTAWQHVPPTSAHHRTNVVRANAASPQSPAFADTDSTTKGGGRRQDSSCYRRPRLSNGG